jgi:dihydroflavonol-4-reductase
VAKTLVTGAPGFIGGHVTRMLVEQGRTVRAMALPGEGIENLSGLDVEVVRADLLDRDSLARALEGVDRVFHLAAIYALWLRRPEQMFRVNVEGTRRLFELVLERPQIERVVYTSSIAAVGLEAGREPATEKTAFNLWEAHDYVMSKYVADLEVRELIRRGLPAVIVNPAFPFGPGDRAPTPTGEIICNVLAGKYPGYIEGGFNVVDVEDVARGHLAAEQRGRVGESYLLAGTNVEIRDFLALVAEQAGRRPISRKLSLGLMSRVGWLQERWSDWVTGRPPTTTVKAIRYAANYLYYDSSKAIEELGHSVTPMRDSVARSVAWFRSDDFLGSRQR